MKTILKVKEVMKMLGISRSRYDQLINDGTLPYCLKPNSSHKFHLESHIETCKRNLEKQTVFKRQTVINGRLVWGERGILRDRTGKRLTGLEKSRALLKGSYK